MRNESKWRKFLVYGLNASQLQWSSAKLRMIMNDKRYHRIARNYCYAELIRRKHDYIH